MNSPYITSSFKKLQQFLFPVICGICKQKSNSFGAICKPCRSYLPWVEDRCYRCGKREETANSSKSNFESEANPALHCQACGTHPPAFDRLCALFNYESPISELILSLKFKKNLSAGVLLGHLLSETLPIWYKRQPFPQAIIPVPLHQFRLRQRGYNQSLEILKPCKKILKQLNIPILNHACQRVRNTPPQASLRADKRNQNLLKSFKVTQALPFEHLAIVDDVVTTGSTVNALAKVLKKAGVETVDIWCICRG